MQIYGAEHDFKKLFPTPFVFSQPLRLIMEHYGGSNMIPLDSATKLYAMQFKIHPPATAVELLIKH